MVSMVVPGVSETTLACTSARATSQSHVDVYAGTAGCAVRAGPRSRECVRELGGVLSGVRRRLGNILWGGAGVGFGGCSGIGECGVEECAGVVLGWHVRGCGFGLEGVVLGFSYGDVEAVVRSDAE